MQLEDNVPMPVKRDRVEWPYGKMGVGDSFLVAGDGKNLLVSVCARNKREGDKLGMRLTAKKVEGGVRVWRVE